MKRTLLTVMSAHDSMDGAGVKIKRTALTRQGLADPFLLLDEIRSDDPEDFIAGFPPHPHRGIETLTYIRHGGIQHEDHMGNKGEVRSGGAQWMSAGRGVIHGEMPLRENDRLHGFQLWINLSAANKMKNPDYRDVPKEEIPTVEAQGFTAHVLSGAWDLNGETITGPLTKLEANAAYVDLEISAGCQFAHDIPSDHQVIAYVYEGEIQVAEEHVVGAQKMALFNDTGAVEFSSSGGAKVLLLHGKPHREPVVNYGPFVMNTMEEIEQAIQDYQNGTLAI